LRGWTELLPLNLGETASNLRKVFDIAVQLPTVLFLDEFDALARARTDAMEHNEIRRVVNSLLMMIDRFAGKGLLIAATNLESSIDYAAWRRFAEVMLFDRPTLHQIKSPLRLRPAIILWNSKFQIMPGALTECLLPKLSVSASARLRPLF
jgi:SpoVK/Ycf46/Vps4 family AAA+-type ATPase